LLKVSSTEIQNNFGKYLMLAQDQDIIITRNGQDVARLSAIKTKEEPVGYVAEAISGGYGVKKASFKEFLELTKDSQERYEYIDGEIFLQASPKTDHQLAVTGIFGAFYSFFVGTKCIPIVAPYDITIKRSAEDINVVQPDLMVICDLEENLAEDGYYYGVPTLLVEVLSENTRRHDLLKKLNLYLEGGVEEYWVINPFSQSVLIYYFNAQEITELRTYRMPEKACSIKFPNLEVDLEQVFKLSE